MSRAIDATPGVLGWRDLPLFAPPHLQLAPGVELLQLPVRRVHVGEARRLAQHPRVLQGLAHAQTLARVQHDQLAHLPHADAAHARTHTHTQAWLWASVSRLRSNGVSIAFMMDGRTDGWMDGRVDDEWETDDRTGGTDDRMQGWMMDD